MSRALSLTPQVATSLRRMPSENEPSREIVAVRLAEEVKKRILDGSLDPADVERLLRRDAQAATRTPKTHESHLRALPHDAIERIRKLPPRIEIARNLQASHEGDAPFAVLRGEWDDSGRFRVGSFEFRGQVGGEVLGNFPPRWEIREKLSERGVNDLTEWSSYDLTFSCSFGSVKNKWPIIAPPFLIERQTFSTALLPDVALTISSIEVSDNHGMKNIRIVAHPVTPV